MEVSGRSEKSSRDSGKMSDILCQPCSNDGQKVKAEGFCQNCKEYLCVTCITYHRKVTLSKSHVILDTYNMPKNVQQVSTTVCTEICDKHATEVVKFFCKQHETVGCGDCMVLEHKSCKVDYIPYIAEAYLTGGDINTLIKEIHRLQAIVKSASQKNVTNEKEAAKAYTETVNDIRTFRKEINDHLDRMEQQLIDKCDKIKQENGDEIKKMGKDLKAIEKELDTVHAQLTSQTEPSTDIFVKAKKATSTLKTLESQSSAAGKTYKIKICQLNRSQDINDVVSKCGPLGEIKVRNIPEWQQLEQQQQGEPQRLQQQQQQRELQRLQQREPQREPQRESQRRQRLQQRLQQMQLQQEEKKAQQQRQY